MRKTISLALMLLMVTQLVPAAFADDTVASQITAMPTGARIELRLKNKQKIRGARGAVSNTGFALVDATGEHQIAFDDVKSVKQLSTKSHTTRNILIGVGIGVAAVAAIIAIIAIKNPPKLAPL
jgi:hypothetical protein